MVDTGALPLTGERTVPNLAHENYWFRRHEAAYEWVCEQFLSDFVSDEVTTIVDAGCGEGFGVDMLARHSDRACSLGLELDWATALHAGETYGATSSIAVANLDTLPLRAESVDLFVSMQVVEHLWDLPRFLAEALRALKPGGTAVFTTPNRLTFSPDLNRGERPTNPFHVEEFDSQQLTELVDIAGFTDVRVTGLQHGNRIQEWQRQNGSLVQAQIDAAVRDAPWPAALADLVCSVTTSDFDIDSADIDGCLDLIIVATKEP